MVTIDNILYSNIDQDLTLSFGENELMDEWFWYLDHPEGELTLRCTKTKIIRFFQQDNFYRTEKFLWKNEDIKKKIVENRIKYLNKTPDQLTTSDILRGFKISGLCQGYSGFNPQLCKWFYNRASSLLLKNTKDLICYDPCGGWGHRMLGSTEIYKYIYNDLSTSTFDSTRNIKNFFDMWNCDLYNNDARSFIPEDEFDIMFTCPPYYNLEKYECGEFKDINEYNEFLDDLFNIFYTKSSCKILGMVIREDLIPSNHIDYTEKYELTQYKKIYLNGSGKRLNKEFLFIWQKP